MAISPIPQAPFRQDRKVFLTPIVGDVLFSEVRDCSRIAFPAYGTPHPDAKKWPSHKLVYIKSVDIERDGLFEFFYAADRKDQDLYNFSFGTRNVVGAVGGREFRIVLREYVTPRSEFDPDYGGFNGPMPDVPEGTFDGVDYVFFEKQQKKIDQPELDSLYVAETVTYIETAFLTQKISFAAQKPDLIPQKFRPNVPEFVTEGIEAGLIQIPTLGPQDLQVSQNQLNPNVKLVRSVTRGSSTSALTSPPATPLGGEEYGDIVTRTVQESLVNEGTPADTGIDVVSSVVEALGDGKAIKQTKRAKNGWPDPVEDEITKEIPDTIPAKFKGGVTQSKKSRKISAVPSTVTLTGNEKAKLFKRETPDRVDETTVTEVIDSGNLLLGNTQTNNGQLADVTESLHKGTKPTAATSATTVDVSVESLGGDLWLKREIKVPEVFPNKNISKTKPDNIPAKFQTENPTSVIEETVAGQIPAEITLAINEESKSENQVTPHLKRVRTVSRVSQSKPVTLTGTRAYVEGTEATVEESYSPTELTADTGLLIAQSVATPLGDGSFVKETVRVEEWPELKSAEWDYELNTAITRTEQFVEPPENLNQPNTTFRAVNKDRTLKIVEQTPAAALLNYLAAFPTEVDLQLPEVLKSVNIIWSEDKAEGSSDSEASGAVVGSSGSLSANESGQGTSSGSLQPELVIDIERPWGRGLSATAYFFYIETNNNTVTEGMLLNRLSSFSGSVLRWPTFRPVSRTIITQGARVAIRADADASASRSFSSNTSSETTSETRGKSFDVSLKINSTYIPPTLHSNVTFEGPTDKDLDLKAIATADWGGINFPSVSVLVEAKHKSKAKVSPTSFPATSPPDIPRSGLYVVQSRVEPFKWGWAKCSAIVFNANQLA